MNCIAITRLAACTLLSSLAAAQGPHWIAPGTSASREDTFFDFSSHPLLQPLTTHARPIYACNVSKMPSDPPGQWTVSFTIRGLQGFGNPGFSGMLLAEWNPASATPLVLTNYADAVNGPFIDYNLHLEPITTDATGAVTGGRYGVFDRFSNIGGVIQFEGAYFAARPHDRSPFGEEVPIANLQGLNGFGDPALGYIDGQLKIFYSGLAINSVGVQVGGILMDDLLGAEMNTPMAAGNPVLVDQPVRGMGWYSHSVAPLTGADGDVEGLFVAESDGTQSDIYFAADLDPETPHVLTASAGTRLHSGGSAGGVAIFANQGNEEVPWMVHGAWLLGDVVAPGGIADLTMSVYARPSGPTGFAVIYGGGWLPNPITHPVINGSLAVSPLFGLRGMVVPSADQTVVFRLSVPPLAGLIGTDVPVQGFARHTEDSGAVMGTWTNTATIRIR